MTFKKPFSEELFENHDPKARLKVQEIFKKSKTLILKKPSDKYSADFDVFKGEKLIGHLELEVKNNWDSQKFPFNDVQFLERKQKYDKHTVWVLFNKDLTRHLIARVREIVKCPKRQLSNRFSGGQKESFYVVPLSIVKFDGLEAMIEFEDGRKS